MPNVTPFDPRDHHIRFVGNLKTCDAVPYEFRAVLDTGAPATEFSDQFLSAAGLIASGDPAVSLKPGLQTQKYGKILIPKITICGHDIWDMTVFISHFDKHWGVDALIGLDFFRQFRVTVDYGVGQIITESLAA